MICTIPRLRRLTYWYRYQMIWRAFVRNRTIRHDVFLPNQRRRRQRRPILPIEGVIFEPVVPIVMTRSCPSWMFHWSAAPGRRRRPHWNVEHRHHWVWTTRRRPKRPTTTRPVPNFYGNVVRCHWSHHREDHRIRYSFTIMFPITVRHCQCWSKRPVRWRVSRMDRLVHENDDDDT